MVTTSKYERSQAAFLRNMERINSLVRLVESNDALKPVALFQSEGVRGDILRSIVVFLHATFEAMIRGYAPTANRKFRFYSGPDLDQALNKISGVDARSFESFYPPLIQMAAKLRVFLSSTNPNGEETKANSA